MTTPASTLPAWSPKDESEVQVPAEELAARFLKGDLQLVGGRDYQLTGADGKVWDVPAEGVAEALRTGYRFSERSEVIRADAPGQNLQALAEGILNGATFGLGDKILVDVVGEDPEAVRARAEANPLMHGGGIAIGAGGLAAATGGGAGLALSRVVGARAAAAGLGARTAGFLGGAVGTGVEGAVYGAGEAVSEAALGRTDVTAERLLAGAGAGGFWGAAIGGPFGALFGKARPRDADIEAVYAAATGNEPAPGLGGMFRKAQERLQAARRKAAEVGGASPAFVRAAFGKDADEWLRMAQGGQEEVDEAARALQSSLAKHLAHSERLIRQRVGTAHTVEVPAFREPVRVATEPVVANLDPLTDPTFAKQAATAAERARAAHAKELERFRAGLKGLSAEEWKAAQPELDALVARLDADVEAAVAPIRARASAKQAERVAAAEARAGVDAGRAAAAEVQRLAGLRDEAAAGAAVGARSPLERARQRVIDHFRSGLEHVSPVRVEAFVKQLTRPKGNAVLRDIAEYRSLLQADAEQAAVSARLFEGPKRFSAERARQQVLDEELAAALEGLERRVVARNQFREQMQREWQRSDVGPWLARVAGFAVGGPLGGLAAGAAVEATSRPLHALLRRSAQRRALEAVREYAKGGAHRMVAGARVPKLPRALAGALPRAVAPTTVLMLDGNPEERQQALQRRVEELGAVAYNPTLTTERLEAVDDGDPATGLPDAGNLIRQRLVELNEYLRQRLPQPRGTGRRARVLDAELRKFARRDAVAQDPLRLVDDLADGRVVDPGEVEVVRRFYPSVLEDFKEGVVELLADDPDALSWEQTIRLGVALGLLTHDSLAPTNLAAQQARAQEPLQDAPEPTRPKPPAGDQGRGAAAVTYLDSLQEQ